MDADCTRFKEFLTSSYMMRKLLGIGKQEKTYAVCSSCNKLYKVTEILNDQSDSGFKCSHVEFSNHPRHSQRQPCGTELTKKVLIVKGHIIRPKMVFPLPSLKTQLISMYQRPGFES